MGHWRDLFSDIFKILDGMSGRKNYERKSARELGKKLDEHFDKRRRERKSNTGKDEDVDYDDYEEEDEEFDELEEEDDFDEDLEEEDDYDEDLEEDDDFDEDDYDEDDMDDDFDD